jgi:hypothetical protein
VAGQRVDERLKESPIMAASVTPFDQKKAWHESARDMRRIVSLSLEKRRTLAEKHGLDFESAIAKIDRYIEQAALVGQYGAVASLLGMQMKIAGLLVERMELEHKTDIDLFGAIAEARRRVATYCEREAIDAEPEPVDVFTGA